MAGKGNTIPKPASQRRRTNAAPPETPVVTDGEVRGPDLPLGLDWPAQTRIWWDTWRRSPQSQLFTGTDWDFLLDTAMLHAELWAGNLSVCGELRLRVAKLGATPEDRLRLRVQVDEEVAKQQPDAQPPLDDRRQRLKVV